MGFIYKISTTQSPKVYIGKTEGTIEDRYKGHLKQFKNGTNYHLYNAMKKYGVDTFKIEQIEECSNDILSQREEYWIQYFDSFYNGYNMTKGGEGYSLYDYKELANKYLELRNIEKVAQYFNCSVKTVRQACRAENIQIKKGLSSEYWNSEEGQKRKNQIRQLGLDSKGRIVSEEIRKKQSEIAKKRLENTDVWNKGKKLSNGHKQKLIENSAMAKSVVCVETGEIYSSALQASKAIGLKSSAGISKCCKGERKTAGGYHWRLVKEGEYHF